MQPREVSRVRRLLLLRRGHLLGPIVQRNRKRKPEKKRLEARQDEQENEKGGGSALAGTARARLMGPPERVHVAGTFGNLRALRLNLTITASIVVGNVPPSSSTTADCLAYFETCKHPCLLLNAIDLHRSTSPRPICCSSWRSTR